jgi:cell wall-associated NlpC family hydrolase
MLKLTLMGHPQPRGLDRRCVEKLLSTTRNDRAVGSRIDRFSRHFVGHPYEQNPLIGAADASEVFTASLDGFDCVTYIETILALARSSTVEDFSEWLRKIRYARGNIHWARRNHYITQWISNNVRNGVIGHISLPSVPIVSRERLLDVVPRLAARRVVVECVSKPAVRRLEPYLRTGDLIFFASTRRNLDVFHAGIIVRNGENILMRHSSRSHGGVVEQHLSEFLKANRMAGVIVMRPQRVKQPVAVSG